MPLRISHRLLLALLLSATMSSCIPVNLPPPERVELVTPTKSRATTGQRPLILIEVLPFHGQERENPKSPRPAHTTKPQGDSEHVGSQFLFRVIPLTSIRVNPVEFLAPVLTEELKLHGFDSVVATPEGPLTGSWIRLRVIPGSLTVNAYDLLLIRRLAVTGVLRIQMEDHHGARRERVIVIDESRYEKFGFLPTLSNFAAKAIRLRLSELVDELQRRNYKRHVVRSSAIEPSTGSSAQE